MIFYLGIAVDSDLSVPKLDVAFQIVPFHKLGITARASMGLDAHVIADMSVELALV